MTKTYAITAPQVACHSKDKYSKCSVVIAAHQETAEEAVGCDAHAPEGMQEQCKGEDRLTFV